MMKKTVFQKIRFTATLLILQLTIVPHVYALDVSINGSENLSLIGGIDYNYQTNPATIEFDIVDPFLCTSTFPDGFAPITLEVNNGDILSGNKVTYASYDIANNLFKVNTNAVIQCASNAGIFDDLINTNGFEASSFDFSITLLDETNNPFVNPEIANSQIVEYRYVVTNNGTSATVDILENYLSAGTTFGNVDAGPDWTCASTHSPVNCGSGNGFVSIENKLMQANEIITITAIRKAIVPNVGPTHKLDLLAAVFVKDKSEADTSNNTVLQAFASSNNTPPTIGAIALNAFMEDSQSSVTNFTVTDPNMNNNDIVVTATSNNTSIIPNNPANIILGGSGTNRTIQLIPLADANTQTSSVAITISANDGIATISKTVNVTISPINDEPSFDFACTDNIVDSQTGQVTCNGVLNRAIDIDNFITNISMGNSFDDSAQAVQAYTVTITAGDDPNGIIHSDIGGPSVSIDPMTNKLSFSLVSGNYGTATIKVQMQDDGGTLPGDDTSIEKEFTITVPIPTYVFTANVINLPASENFSLRLVDTTGGGNSTVALTSVNNNGTKDIGQLPLASDYKIFIDGNTGGAANCTIAGADGNGDLIGTNISAHLTFDVDCQ